MSADEVEQEPEGVLADTGEVVDGSDEAAEETPEDIEELMEGALAHAYVSMEAEDHAEAADALWWILDRWEFLPPHVHVDGIILALVRVLFILGEYEDGMALLDEVDPEAVQEDPWRRAEFAMHQIGAAQLRGDFSALQRAVRAAIEPVQESDDEEHHAVLRTALAGLGSAAHSGDRDDLRMRVTGNLADDGDEGLQRAFLELHAESLRTPGDVDVQNRTLDLAVQMAEAGHLWHAVGAFALAGMTATQRGDADATLRIAQQGLELVRDRQVPAMVPAVTQLRMLAAVGRGGEGLDEVLEEQAASGSDLLAGHALLVRAGILLKEGADPWGALGTALTAHRMMSDYQQSLPSAGERRGVDNYLRHAAGVAVRAADACADARTMAEVIEVVRAQGSPATPGDAVGAAEIPLWAVLDVGGFDRVRPRWQTEEQEDPAILTGRPPLPRMPWGRIALSGLQPATSGGQIVDIFIRRPG